MLLRCQWQTTCLFILFLLVAGGAVQADSEREQPKYNVVMIIVDDLRPSLGAYGDTAAYTPNIDELLGRGVRFDNMHTSKSVCAPSRASMLTGKRPDQLRVWGFKPNLRARNPGLVTLPGALRAHGYTTEAVGKVFDGRSFPDEAKSGLLGPDTCTTSALTEECSWDQYISLQSIKVNKEGVCGLENQMEMFPGSGFQDPLNRQARLVYEYEDKFESHDVDHCIASVGVRRLESLANSATPFFLTVGFSKPHMPWTFPSSIAQLIQTKSDDLFASTGDESFWNEQSSIWSQYASGEMKSYEGYKDVAPIDRAKAYYSAVSYVDSQVKRLVDALNASPAQNNTIFFFWGDHGFHLGEVGNVWGKKTMFEMSTRVPFGIVMPPGSSGILPSSVASPTESVDIMPTVAALCNVDLEGLDLAGTSLVPLLSNPAGYVRAAAISQYTSHHKKNWEGFSIRTQRYRLIVYLKSKQSLRMSLKVDNPFRLSSRRKEELYEYTSSGSVERINQFDSVKFRSVRKEMLKLLRKGLKKRSWSYLLYRRPFDFSLVL